MDMSLLAVGSLIAASLAIGAIWHAVIRSYGWAVIATAFTVGVATYVVYPTYAAQRHRRSCWPTR